MADETWPKKVRTTMNPGKEIEVGPEEYLDLSRQGLLHKGETKTATASAEQAGRGTAKEK